MSMNGRMSRVEAACLPELELHLERFFDSMAQQGFSWNAEMSRYHFSTGGKRLRALIPCCIYEAHGRDPRDAFPLSAALELIHNATLVHDDLQDGDTVRRGKPTVWKRFSAPQAINCGDALFFFAQESLLRMSLPSPVLLSLMRRLSRGTLRVIEGQAQEFRMKEEESPGLERYLEVASGKTAALIATAVASGLDALGADEALCAQAESAAMKCGILFQIQDDLLDIHGEKGREAHATDIAEGKVSALVASLNDVATGAEKRRVSTILRSPREAVTPGDVDEVIALFEKYRVRQALTTRIRAIEESVRGDAALQSHPAVLGLLVEMNTKFLKPIQFLFEEPAWTPA